MNLEPKVRDFLAAPRYAVLATVNPSGAPQLTEMWYGLRGEELFFNTSTDRTKRRNLERDPRVSLLVSSKKGDPIWSGPLVYVRVDGVVREIASGKDGHADIHALGVRYDGQQAADTMLRDHWSKQERVTYAIDVKRVYAKGL